MRLALLVLSLTLLLSACQAPATANQETVETPTPITAPTLTSPAVTTPIDVVLETAPPISQAPRNEDAADLNLPPIESVAKEGMIYGVLREELLMRSWQPMPTSECESNVGGSGAAQLCSKLPELDSCSADGHCLMAFKHWDGRSIVIHTYGEIGNALAIENSGLMVQDFSIQKQ